jgi:hypothetical protein
MDFDKEIIIACKQLISEATAIIDYSEAIIASENDAMKNVYRDNRGDELPHVQNIAVALTAMLNGEEPTEAENMDEGGDENGGDS